MISKSFSNLFSLLIIICFFCVPLKSEEKIDIWKKDKEQEVSSKENMNSPNNSSLEKIDSMLKDEIINKILKLYEKSRNKI